MTTTTETSVHEVHETVTTTTKTTRDDEGNVVARSVTYSRIEN